MARCEICGRKIEKGSGFILDGNMPGFWGKYWDFHTMEFVGHCYHKTCYLKRIMEQDSRDESS